MGVGSYLRCILYFISNPTMVYHAKSISTGLGVLQDSGCPTGSPFGYMSSGRG